MAIPEITEPSTMKELTLRELIGHGIPVRSHMFNVDLGPYTMIVTGFREHRTAREHTIRVRTLVMAEGKKARMPLSTRGLWEETIRVLHKNKGLKIELYGDDGGIVDTHVYKVWLKSMSTGFDYRTPQVRQPMETTLIFTASEWNSTYPA